MLRTRPASPISRLLIAAVLLVAQHAVALTINATDGGGRSGYGVVAYTVEPNATSGFRRGKITVGGKVFHVVQAGISAAGSWLDSGGDNGVLGGGGGQP